VLLLYPLLVEFNGYIVLYYIELSIVIYIAGKRKPKKFVYYLDVLVILNEHLDLTFWKS